MNRIFILSLILVESLYGCTTKEHGSEKKETNPAADGFNIEGSDKKAIAIADSVMAALGGRQNYDRLRYISWNFFGARDLIWDKKMGRARIEFPSKNTTYLLDLNSMKGKVKKDGEEITNPDSLKTYLSQGKSFWINDSYWLVMPFKLKDSGVTLKYTREDTLPGGDMADVITMTFDNVGDTPNNKYEVYVGQTDHMVKQWAYFKNASQDSASAVWLWDNYAEYNGVMLSANRSDDKGPKDVKVYDELSDEVFTSFEKPQLQ